MSLTIQIYYSGTQGRARRFATEMEESGIAEAIRRERGNRQYEYFFPMADPETVLLIDRWEDQAALDAHHRTEMMQKISALREKYDLHMRVERLMPADAAEDDARYIRA